ncbi:hypothetical protein N657DRAFT_388658 [Parathielavia appendiculata]|uniref:Uncharacterized protein n=1 Tax=Parathielavia appendiculata TaxID=2587402 RepID=A0AAN6U0Y4_9PEZI|nr:hypothetical protein N657DRAFT_388658 [Parathielavia appendiculata]
MRRASQVWRSMLFGPWKESKPAQGDWDASLPDDKPCATRVLLSIVHGTFCNVPKTVGVVQLYDIVLLVDKYALLRALQPWVNPWERLMKAHATWKLGSEELLSVTIRDLVWGMTVGSTDDDGGASAASYAGGGLLTFEEHLGPPDLLEMVTKLRLSVIQDSLDFFNRELDARSHTHPAWPLTASPKRRASLTSASHCDAVILGRIWWSFRQLNEDLLPRHAREYSKSAFHPLWLLSDTFTVKMKAMPALDGYRHDGCIPLEKWSKFKAATRNHERLKNFLQPHLKKRLAAQRAKIGL